MHYHHIEDEDGDLAAVVPFCCDSCHRGWCAENGATYGGWNGCQEGSDSPEWCAQCGVRCGIGSEGCDADCLTTVVNLLTPIPGNCAHGLPFTIEPSLVG